MKAGADLQQAAHPAAEPHAPAVGSVIRLRIFSRVLLPAPLRPMMPTTSPCWTSKETSLRAQNSSELEQGAGSGEGGDGDAETRRRGDAEIGKRERKGRARAAASSSLKRR